MRTGSRPFFALDALIGLLGIAAAAMWSLTPYPRSEEKTVWVLWSGAVAALSIAYAAGRRWGWTEEGGEAARWGTIGTAVFVAAAPFLLPLGVIWRLPWHLAMLVLMGMLAYSTLSFGRELLLRLRT